MPTIMYHFVVDDERFKGINIEKFKAQLGYLQKIFSNDEICLTFDHNTIDHITTVAPILEERGFRGIFFILTMIPEEKRVPTIDKQRFLEVEYRLDLAKMVCDELYIKYTPEEASNYLCDYKFYSLSERYLRYLRDQVIPSRVYDSLIGKIFNRIFGNEIDFCLKEYLGWHHVYQLYKRGHIIGSHSHYHFGDVTDYNKSLELIEKVIGERPKLVAYPNGVKVISDEELRSLGIETAYISKEKGIPPYEEGRIDCNQYNNFES